SRRRHTIFSRDWSSDVCSSDLPSAMTETVRTLTRHVISLTLPVMPASSLRSSGVLTDLRRLRPELPASVRKVADTVLADPAGARSEERRVGEEGRAGGEPWHSG